MKYIFNFRMKNKNFPGRKECGVYGRQAGKQLSICNICRWLLLVYGSTFSKYGWGSGGNSRIYRNSRLCKTQIYMNWPPLITQNRGGKSFYTASCPFKKAIYSLQTEFLIHSGLIHRKT